MLLVQRYAWNRWWTFMERIYKFITAPLAYSFFNHTTGEIKSHLILFKSDLKLLRERLNLRSHLAFVPELRDSIENLLGHNWVKHVLKSFFDKLSTANHPMMLTVNFVHCHKIWNRVWSWTVGSFLTQRTTRDHIRVYVLAALRQISQRHISTLFHLVQTQ